MFLYWTLDTLKPKCMLCAVDEVTQATDRPETLYRLHPDNPCPDGTELHPDSRPATPEARLLDDFASLTVTKEPQVRLVV